MADLIYPVKDRLRSRRAVTKTSYFPLEGGLDIVTPALSIPPGRAIGMVNFEPWYQGGYRRIPGYERFDGRPKPSDALFDGFDVDDVAGLTLRDVITGDTSGATGVLCGIYDDDGSFGSDTIGVTKVVGAFQDAETCNGGAFLIESDPISLYAPDVDTEETFLLEAENVYRDDIEVVPGANQTNGTWQRLADVYAIRDNVGVTAGILHKATTSGWDDTPITMADTIRFDAALLAGQDVVEGDTLTGGSSGATATIHRIVLNGGSNAYDGAGEGYYVLTGVAGGPFTDNEALESPALTQVADADGANSTFAFSTGGVYQFINHNFFASSATYRVYGCNGVDPAFEIDTGDVVSPILMPKSFTDPDAVEPPTNNTPFLIEEHQNHLFLAFEGGSVQQSVVGEPLVFSGFLGAAEFGLGDEVTGMSSIVGNVLVLSTTRETRGLYGTSTADWNLRIVAEQSGSILFGSQKIDTVYSLDDLGITSVARSEQFGDFISATVSQAVQPLVTASRPRFTDSSIVRESNQFRMYFNDNSFLIMYIPAGTQTETQVRRRTVRSPAEFGFGSYDVTVAMIYNSDDETGKERTYFVTSTTLSEGFVFEDQIGKNFDGEPISSYLRTAFNHLGTPTLRKRFRRADLELNAPQTLSLQFSEDLSYSTAEVSSGITDLETVDIAEVDIFGGGGFWDDADWDDFLWDGTAIATARACLSGTGENISFLIFNESAKASAWEMQGITVHYDRRRLQR